MDQQLAPGKKIYFLSDFHLGAPNYEKSLAREKEIVRFLEHIRADAAVIFILGDMFDFWYEYKNVVPKGYVRVLGKIAEIADSGIPVRFFCGNHDMWMSGYFEKELGVPVFFEPQEYTWNGRHFFLAHGDGLGPGDHKYKMLKKVFRSPLSQWLFGLLHPSAGIGLANYFSRKSREAAGSEEETFQGEEKERLLMFSREFIRSRHVDYFIFGHRHIVLDFLLNDDGAPSRYISIGDWVTHFTYAVFDGSDVRLEKWERL